MNEDFSDRERWCPHGWARITTGEGKGLSACPDCSAEHAVPQTTDIP